MKKILALVLALCMVFALCACGQQAAPAAATTEAAPAAEAAAPAAEEAAPVAAEAEYKLGMGINLSTNSSKEGNAQVDSTLAAVVLNAEGKIVTCRIDVVQDKMDITEGTCDPEKTFRTKMEQGDDYGMLKASAAGLEWYDQAKGFEAFCEGKTADEIAAIETVESNGHNVAVDEVLYASCTMDITAFKAAVVKACADDQGQTFTTSEPFTLGVAANSTAAESTDPTDDEDGVVKMYSEYAAVVLGSDGKILATVNDATQPQIKFNADGEIVDTVFNGTKRELKFDYNMVKYSSAVYEWFEQSKAFSDYCAGLTADEVAGMETVINEEGHQVTTDEALFASCTMSIGGMQAVVAKAAANVR